MCEVYDLECEEIFESMRYGCSFRAHMGLRGVNLFIMPHIFVFCSKCKRASGHNTDQCWRSYPEK